MSEEPVAVVVGGAGGIGLAIAARLARDGHRIVVADLEGEATDNAAREIGGTGIAINVTESGSVGRAIGEVLDKHGRIDVLVNSAGVHLQKLVVDMTDLDWDRVQSVNSRGTFLTCRAVARSMMAAEGGRIVNIVTRLGFGNPYSAAYMASKNAVWGLTQTLAVELAGYGITVNAVAPGHVGPGTGMEKQFREKAAALGLSWEDFEARVLKTIPVGRWCRPDDVAAAVAYVVSPEASFVTGELINVTGGFTGYGVAPPREAG
ncbi:SDR family NAD(P)-dependent oxidoreductase [Bauldia sp.]|uniref:SDR family NAD(P)-dependent oxidoreductase n=1 Tax=Bauldia sp. TaxID=2575872 RepID=UPI003BAC3EA7